MRRSFQTRCGAWLAALALGTGCVADADPEDWEALDDDAPPEADDPEPEPADELFAEPDVTAANWNLSATTPWGGQSATIGWDVVPAPPVDYEFCWKPSAQSGDVCNQNSYSFTAYASSPNFSPSTGRYYLTLNGLQCETEYKVRIKRDWYTFDTFTFTTGGCSCADPCPSGGWFDGANCQIGQAPAGSTAFIYANNYYYTALPGNSCPYPGSWYDGANCFVQAVPAGVSPFIWNNHWYYGSCP